MRSIGHRHLLRIPALSHTLLLADHGLFLRAPYSTMSRCLNLFPRRSPLPELARSKHQHTASRASSFTHTPRTCMLHIPFLPVMGCASKKRSWHGAVAAQPGALMALLCVRGRPCFSYAFRCFRKQFGIDSGVSSSPTPPASSCPGACAPIKLNTVSLDT